MCFCGLLFGENGNTFVAVTYVCTVRTCTYCPDIFSSSKPGSKIFQRGRNHTRKDCQLHISQSHVGLSITSHRVEKANSTVPVRLRSGANLPSSYQAASLAPQQSTVEHTGARNADPVAMFALNRALISARAVLNGTGQLRFLSSTSTTKNGTCKVSTACYFLLHYLPLACII